MPWRAWREAARHPLGTASEVAPDAAAGRRMTSGPPLVVLWTSPLTYGVTARVSIRIFTEVPLSLRTLIVVPLPATFTPAVGWSVLK